MLEISNLTKKYKKVAAVDSISLLYLVVRLVSY